MTLAKRIMIDLSRQLLFAYDGPKLVFKFDCATGDRQHPTPLGQFQIFQKNRFHFSSQYKVQMDYALFFNRGIAIHQAVGVMTVSYLKFAGFDSLGSHGCVRLSQSDARMLFEWAPVNTTVDVRR